jgi:hypothetical protein
VKQSADIVGVLTQLHKRFSNVSLHGANGWGITCWNISYQEEDDDSEIEHDVTAVAMGRTLDAMTNGAKRWLAEHPVGHHD